MAMAPEQTGIGIRRHFTTEGVDPYDEVAWERRDARITNFRDGSVAFEQRDVEFPVTWSLNATNIVAQKYFRGLPGSPERETSLRQVIDRVADTVTAWGVKDGYFVDGDESEAFRAELKHLILHQKASFNSPVWFNIGVRNRPQQASACQPYDALVSTAEGLVPIGRLVESNSVGAKVLDANGFTTITAVKANGRKGVLRIHTRAGYSLDVTADHLVWRSEGDSRGRFVPAGQLEAGDALEWHSTDSWGNGEISRQWVAEAALAGWLQADGFVRRGTGRNETPAVELATVTAAEYHWVLDAVDAVSIAGLRWSERDDKSGVSKDARRLALCAPGLPDFLDRWGLDLPTLDAEVPQQVFAAPTPVVTSYLRSLFQAEGFVSIRPGRRPIVGLAMGSEGCVRGIQSLLLRFGIFSKIRFVAERRPDRRGAWVLNITGADVRRFVDDIGFVDSAKGSELDSADDGAELQVSPTRPLDIERIERLGEMDVYDIQTESGEYLSGNIRVHNCFILAVEDTMQSILNWYVEEGTIFKGGSGAGINLSTIRSSQESLKGGGTASGPVSFMRGADASAGTIKCLHADTPVSTDGGVIAVRDARPGSQVLTRHGYREIEAVHDNGIRPLVKVTTSLGDEILCTPEHRFRVRSSLGGERWREAKDIGPDDYLVVDLSSSYPGQRQSLEPVTTTHHNESGHSLPEELDEALGLWLGWIFGDGSITDRGSERFVAIQLGDSDEELAERYKAVSRSVFGDTLHFFESRHGDKADASTSLRFSSSQIIRFLGLNGLRKGKAAELRVPAAIQSSPPAVRAAFISGLFEADGCIENGYPSLSTVSRGLALDVHRLLLSIGIPSKLGCIKNRPGSYGTLPIQTVRVVGGEGLRRFGKLVGFVSERKSRLLEAAIERKDRSLYENQWFLPHVAPEFDVMWEEGPPNTALKRAMAPYCRYAKPRSLSLLRTRALIDRFPDDLALAPFARFADGNEIYVRATVEPAGEGPTFDLTVHGVHEYMVNGLPTHNSGGTTRRAAKMVILNADHPDVEDFIWCKAVEERKARVLRDAGFDMDLDGKDSHSTQYQNANNSVRVTDEFMQAVVDDADWHLREVLTGDPVKTLKARELFRQIALATWECADPGMQFDTTINRWHTASNTGPITASNPCSEYMHVDNSACNLASLNLLKFLDDDTFDVEGFKAAVAVLFTAQEILVGNADYPTEKIAENSRRFRQLGLGYANLGAMLMAKGLPYDSDEGRAWASAITALMTGHAYATSGRTAVRMGPFAGYSENREPMHHVLRMHRDELGRIDESLVAPDLLSAAHDAWDSAVETGEAYGVRNSQATVLAPTGCLVGGSLVPTDHGLVRLRSLGDVDGPEWQDLDAVVATDRGPREATRFYVNGLEPVVSVETARGYSIQGTPQHRVRVVDVETGEWQWRRFADLVAGDMVPMALDQMVGEPLPVVLPVLGSGVDAERLVMTPQLAEIVGFFMGSGAVRDDQVTLTVDASDFEVVERLERLGKDALDRSARVSFHGVSVELNFGGADLVPWWTACGFDRRAGAGHVPDTLLATNDRRVYTAFLRGLFEADATVTSGSPHWSTSDVELAHDVHSMLLALGYPAACKPAPGAETVVNLRLLDSPNTARWLDEIGFVSGRKHAAVVSGHDRQAAPRNDLVPLTRALVARLIPCSGKLHDALAGEIERGGGVPRPVATMLFEECADPELGHLLSFFYDTVTTADLGGEELTYDISVPDNVTYIANGFVSHNTIGLMMDCDTTGIEPDLGLCKTKKLVGGGTMSIVNQTVPRALAHMGYSKAQADEIITYIDEHKSILGAPHLRPEHVAVFACSMGDNVIHYLGHVKMMAAVQPWISGAISKCLTGSTIIPTADGLIRIGSLRDIEPPNSFRDEYIEVASLDGTQKTDAFYYGGVRPVRNVVLRSGHHVTGTPNHRLLVGVEGGLEWKRLDEIDAGDYVATQYGSEMWSQFPARFDDFAPSPPYGGQKAVRTPQEMNDELAFLLGAYASEGHTSRSNWTVTITNSVDSVLERVATAWVNQFGVDARIVRQPNRCAGVVVASKTIVQFLDHVGCGERASAKRIPDAVLRSTREIVLAFLQGLALDAYVSVTGAPRWGICPDAPKLLDDLQAVLTNLGIVHGRVSKVNKLNGKTYDEVFATGQFARRLVELVPFIEPDKARRADELCALSYGNHNTADIVPGITLRELYDTLPYGMKNAAGRLLRTEFDYLHDRRTYSIARSSLERVSAIPGMRLAPWLQSILDDNLHFSPVESVADAGECEVFDLSVPSTHAFVGNGIVNHNTINMPEEATVEEVEQLHTDAWKLGLKAVAIYRDNCKVAQPLSNTKRAAAPLVASAEQLAAAVREPVREKLPRTRSSKTFSFRVADCHGYVTVGEYDDGRPGEIFLRVAKQGSTLAGVMDAFAISVSHGLQYGVPLRAFVDMYTNMRFEPAGLTDDPDLRFASSLVDYIFRRLAVEYLPYEDRAEIGILTVGERTQPTLPGVEEGATPSAIGSEIVPDPAVVPAPVTAPTPPVAAIQPAASDAPYCYQCGMVMQRAGACFVCSSCGTTSGCS